MVERDIQLTLNGLATGLRNSDSGPMATAAKLVLRHRRAFRQSGEKRAGLYAGPMDGAPDEQQREPRFLVVCSANICRSPMAEALLRHRLDAIGVDATVLSTGHLARGVEVSKRSVTAMAERGLDIAGRSSVVTSAKHVAGADVILTMGRSHVRKVLELDLAAWPRTFPLRMAVARALLVGQRSRHETLPGWVARLHEGRTAIDVLNDEAAEEIRDPFGMGLREYRATATLLDELLAQFVSLAFPR